jgi:hypothetical protein
VAREDVPAAVARLGGRAVVKVPYANAGQGVYTILGASELDAFMAATAGTGASVGQRYDTFIVQALVGSPGWSSTWDAEGDGDGAAGSGRPLYHVGTLPNARGETFVADLRVMVAGGPGGFAPVSLYARRARDPLLAELPPGGDGGSGAGFSWGM